MSYSSSSAIVRNVVVVIDSTTFCPFCRTIMMSHSHRERCRSPTQTQAPLLVISSFTVSLHLLHSLSPYPQSTHVLNNNEMHLTVYRSHIETIISESVYYIILEH